MGDIYAEIHIGGTNTVIGLFDQYLKLVAKQTMLTPKPDRFSAPTDPSPFLDLLAAEVRKLVKGSGNERHLPTWISSMS